MPRATNLTTRTARLKLAPRHMPYTASLAQGVFLRYRRHRQPFGTWDMRIRRPGKDLTVKLGIADDVADANGRTILDYWQAAERGREAMQQNGGVAAPATLAATLDDYEADLKLRGGELGTLNRVRKSLADSPLLARRLNSLEAADFKAWRTALAKQVAPASVNRIQSTFKAALNLAARDDAYLSDRAWKFTLTGLPDSFNSRNVILADAVVAAIVAEAYVPHRVDPQIIEAEAKQNAERLMRRTAQAFGLLVEVVAATGTRVGQAADLMPEDVICDPETPHLMMPPSKKGRGTKRKPHRHVPIELDLAERLRALALTRKRGAPLLAKGDGSPWLKNDHTRPFRRTVKRLIAQARAAGDDATLDALEQDDVGINALRHSSITRDLLNGVPIRVVAEKHDTSVLMIERTYSRFISHHSDAALRRGMLTFSAPQPPSNAGANNVVPLTRRR